MGLSASQGRMLLLTARKSDLEFRAQQISQKRLMLSQQLEEIAVDYEDATSNRQMKIKLNAVNESDSDKQSATNPNLTYANLVSGTVGQVSPSQSGIQGYGRTAVDTSSTRYESSSFYRLVDSSGAIVVSNVGEIPTSGIEKTSKPTAASNGYTYKDSNGSEKTSSASNFYTAKIVSSKNGIDQTSYSYYVKAPQGSALENVLGSSESTNVQAYPEKGYVTVQVKNSKKITLLANGSEYTGDAQTNALNDLGVEKGVEAVLIKSSGTMMGQTTEETTVEYSLEGPGSDGLYTLVDGNGVTVNRYRVDASLQAGNSEPNYIQDCIRNGKYLIQKGRLDTEGEDPSKYIWNSISWDATSNISDSYYTEDDDAAKAKYDRLQGQIQAQDKKLELELDNIETQRNAVNTEIDSVDKVMQDNIEKTFKTFA